MNTLLKNNAICELSQQETRDINGGNPIILIPIAIAFAVGVYNGYQEEANKNNPQTK